MALQQVEQAEDPKGKKITSPKVGEVENFGNDITNLCPSEKDLILYPINFGLTWEVFKSQSLALFCPKYEKKIKQDQERKALQKKLGTYLTPRTTSLLSDLSSHKSPSRIGAPNILSHIIEEEAEQAAKVTPESKALQ